jgi:hypothetical protein
MLIECFCWSEDGPSLHQILKIGSLHWLETILIAVYLIFFLIWLSKKEYRAHSCSADIVYQWDKAALSIKDYWW